MCPTQRNLRSVILFLLSIDIAWMIVILWVGPVALAVSVLTATLLLTYMAGQLAYTFYQHDLTQGLRMASVAVLVVTLLITVGLQLNGTSFGGFVAASVMQGSLVGRLLAETR